MSLVSRHITAGQLLRNWSIVYVGNLVGALSIAIMVWGARWWAQDDAAVGAAALTIAASKTSLAFGVVLVRAVLANALVCLAVWLAAGGRTVLDKIAAIVLPISAFVAAGFEHSVANMYFIPAGWLIKDDPAVVRASGLTGRQLADLDLQGFMTNLTAATVGNVIGGAVLVGLVYWFVYLRDQRT
jgi:formate transporter